MSQATLNVLQERFKKLHDQVKGDPKVMLNTLIHYFGGVDSLWYAIHEHVTDMHDMNQHGLVDIADTIRDLEDAYEKAVGDVIEQEFLVNDN